MTKAIDSDFSPKIFCTDLEMPRLHLKFQISVLLDSSKENLQQLPVERLDMSHRRFSREKVTAEKSITGA